MNRRGFLQCLGAVSAAIASGVRLPAEPAALPTPRQKDLLATVLELLEHCKPIGYERHESISGPSNHVVEYLYDPKNEYRGQDFSDLVGRFPETRRPVSICARSESNASLIDARHLGDRLWQPPLQHFIEIVWA
jgi:hypothetical protein